MKFFRYKDLGHHISAILSYSGTASLLLLALERTESGFSRQTEHFIWITLWLLTAALFTLLFSKKSVNSLNIIRKGFTIIDLFAILFFIYLTVNHYLISPVNASGKYLIFLLLGMNYLSLRIILPTYNKMGRFVFLVILACGLGEAILGIRQLFGMDASHHFRFAMTGTFFNPGPYGGYLSIAMSLALYYLIHYHHYFIRCVRQAYRCIVRIHSRFRLDEWLAFVIQKPVIWLYILSLTTFVLSFIIFFGVMSRAAIVAFGICSLFIIWHKRSFRSSIARLIKTHSKKTILCAALLLIMISGACLAIYSVKKDSANGRLLLWRISYDMIVRFPLTGSGFGIYPGAYAMAQSEYFAEHPESAIIDVAGSPEYGFNEYLQLGTETGSIGLILFLLMAGGALLRLIRNRDPLSCGFITLAIFAFFSYPFSLLPFQTMLVVFISAGAVYTRNNTKTVVVNWWKKIYGAGMCIVVICLCFFSAEVLIDKIEAREEWQKIKYLYQAEYYEEAAKDYARLYPMLKDDFRFMFEYGHALNKIRRYEQSNHILIEGCAMSSDPMFYNIIGNNYMSMGDYKLAEEYYTLAFKILPNRLYPLYLLMNLYKEWGQSDRAADMAKKIVAFDPKIESPATKEIKQEAEIFLQSLHNM